MEDYCARKQTTTIKSVIKSTKRMLGIKLSITLFAQYQTCELTEKETVYMLESLKKASYTKDNKKPFVCITGYNGMAIHILGGSVEDLPPFMTTIDTQNLIIH